MRIVEALPQSLLDVIGRYGNARSGGCDEAEIIYRWEELIGAIKRYAESRRVFAEHDASTERERFERWWSTLADDPKDAPELVASCHYAAWEAWQAAQEQSK
jgi:hypothetical protein